MTARHVNMSVSGALILIIICDEGKISLTEWTVAYRGYKYLEHHVRKKISSFTNKMACSTVLRCVFLTESYRPLHRHNRALFSLPLTTVGSTPLTRLICINYGRIRARSFHSARRIHLNCSHNESQSPSADDSDQGPPQEAVLKAISGSSLAILFNYYCYYLLGLILFN